MGVRTDPTLQVGKWKRGFSKEAEWPSFDPSQQASKWGHFPRPLLCKQTQGLEVGGEVTASQCSVASWDPAAPLPLSLPSLGLGAGVGWGQEAC